MSIKHPIIVITGSSGAGTTSVKNTFEQIFRREKINPVYIEGDAFHRWNRADMRERMKEAAAKGDHHYSHFGADANLFEELEATFRAYSETGGGRTRAYVHDMLEAEQHGCPPGTFTPWREFEPGSDLLFYEGLHGAVVNGTINVAQYGDLKIGVVPVINLEWIQKIHRDRAVARLHHGGGDRHDPAPNARLHKLYHPAVRGRRTSISSACRRSTPPIRSLPDGYRRLTNRWSSSASPIRAASTSPISCR